MLLSMEFSFFCLHFKTMQRVACVCVFLSFFSDLFHKNKQKNNITLAQTMNKFGKGNFMIKPGLEMETMLFNKINVTLTIKYTMTMIDKNRNNRTCNDSVFVNVLLLNAGSNSSSNSNTNKYEVTITALKTTINSNERLRLFGNIFNEFGMFINDTQSFIFEWREITGGISNQTWLQGRTMIEGSNNLIFKKNKLQKGQSYIFELKVYKIKNNTMSYIGNDIKTIYVNIGAIILENTFQIFPNCNNLTFINFNQLLQQSFNLIIAADSDFTPLKYQFKYYFIG